MSLSPRATSPSHQPPDVDTEIPWLKSKNSIDIETHDIPTRTPETRGHNMFRLKKPSRVVFFFIVVFLLGTLAVYTPYYRWHLEERMLTETIMDAAAGEHIAFAQLDVSNLILVQTLDQSLVPTSGKHKDRHGRLVIVGDVHGMKDELVKLLDKVAFDKKADHLILAGDMISKGPDSQGVLDLIMELGASAVRGNHEDRVLFAYRMLQFEKEYQLETPDVEKPDLKRDEELSEVDVSRAGRERDRLLAKELTKKQVHWLERCPVILRVGDVTGMGEVLVVHAGLVPGVKLHAQNPFMVMNMRTLDPKTHVPSESSEGTEWAEIWNKYQLGLEPHQRSTVIYGHYSKRGLQIREYSKGLDTGCLKGGRLTALVVEGGHSGAKQKLIHVNCGDSRI